MRKNSCWVSVSLSEKNADKLLTLEHWMLEKRSRLVNADFLDDVGLDGGFLKAAELFAKVGFKCVSVRREGKGLNMLFAWNPERNDSYFFLSKKAIVH